jgi:hypothetical protein
LPRLVLVLLIFPLLSGCVDRSGPSCAALECEETPPPRFLTWPPGVDLPPIPEEEALRSLRWEDCSGYFGGVALPQDNVRPHVPLAFDLFVVGTAALVSVELLSCPRVVVNATVLENVLMLQVAPRVEPKERAWSAGFSSSLFPVGWYVSHDEVRRPLTAWGLPAALAQFQVAPHNLNGQTWVINGEGASFTVSFAVADEDAPPSSPRFLNWIGTGPYLRLIRSYKADFHSTTIGTVDADGTGPSANLKASSDSTRSN